MNGPPHWQLWFVVKQVRRAQQQLRIGADQLFAVNDIAVLTSVFALQPT